MSTTSTTPHRLDPWINYVRMTLECVADDEPLMLSMMIGFLREGLEYDRRKLSTYSERAESLAQRLEATARIVREVAQQQLEGRP